MEIVLQIVAIFILLVIAVVGIGFFGAVAVEEIRSYFTNKRNGHLVS